MASRLEIDIHKKRFFFSRDKKSFSDRNSTERYLVSEYGVTKERAEMIISQGAVWGEINLDLAIINHHRIINDGTVGIENE